MKRVFALFLAVGLFAQPAYAVDQWAKTAPAGSAAAADIDSLVQTNNGALDRMVIDYRKGAAVIVDSVATVGVLAGELAIPNSDGSVVRYRRNTATTSVTWSNIDTGAETSATQYYIYAVADTDATTFTVQISASSSAPSGGTYYRKIGYFYNDASGDIVNVGNVAGGDVSNSVTEIGASDITTTSSSYANMTGMSINFIGSGRPVRIIFNGGFDTVGTNTQVAVELTVDGTQKMAGISGGASGQDNQIPVIWEGVLSSGAHTIAANWKRLAGSDTVTQLGATYKRILIAEEK